MTTKPLPYSNKGDLTTGPVKDHLTRLTVPMIWGILAIISFQLVDTFFISLLGTTELAAIGFTFPVTMLVFHVITGLGIGMSSVVSRQIGQGDRPQVQRLVTHGLLLAFTAGMGIAVIGTLTNDAVFRAMGADETTLPLIRDYMLIWYIGNIFLTLPLVGNAAMRADGDTRTPAIIMLVAALSNVILDPILIFGLFGFPRMELAGAALATVIANAMAMGAGLYILAVKKDLICRGGLYLAEFGNSAKRLLFIALPAGITSMIVPFTAAIITAMLSVHGAEAVAAYGLVARIEAFCFVVIMALAVGMAPVLGQNWGADRHDRVHETLKIALIFCAVWSVIVAIALGLFAKPIIGLFSDDPVILGWASLYFWIVPFSYVFGNLMSGWGSAFNAIGKPQLSFAIIFVRMVVLNIPLAWAGGYFFGITGIFASIAITNVVAGIGVHVWGWKICHRPKETAAAPQAAE